jgi:hypothetical protein
MTASLKGVEELRPEDLASYAVWEFADSTSRDVVVRPVRTLPVKELANKIVGVQVRLANGQLLWATLGNLNLADAAPNPHFLTVSVFSRETWFHLARYHDADYQTHGPSGLGAFLGLPIKQIFPISYDVRQFCIGVLDALVGVIEESVEPQLSRGEIIRLAVETL